MEYRYVQTMKNLQSLLLLKKTTYYHKNEWQHKQGQYNSRVMNAWSSWLLSKKVESVKYRPLYRRPNACFNFVNIKYWGLISIIDTDIVCVYCNKMLCWDKLYLDETAGAKCKVYIPVSMFNFRLTILPVELGLLHSLQHLHLNNNKLHYLPTTIDLDKYHNITGTCTSIVEHSMNIFGVIISY